MKKIEKMFMGLVLTGFAMPVLAHSGHGADGYVHSTIGLEQFLLAFALALAVQGVARIPGVSRLLSRMGDRLKNCSNKKPRY